MPGLPCSQKLQEFSTSTGRLPDTLKFFYNLWSRNLPISAVQAHKTFPILCILEPSLSNAKGLKNMMFFDLFNLHSKLANG